MLRVENNSMSKRFIVPVQVDDEGEYFFNLPDEIMEDLDWREGDELHYEEDINGDLILRKVDPEKKSVKNRVVTNE